jgi:hypothetical protein
MHWSNAQKTMIFIADAPAHGRQFGGYDNHEPEGRKLPRLIQADSCASAGPRWGREAQLHGIQAALSRSECHSRNVRHRSLLPVYATAPPRGSRAGHRRR